MTVKCPICNKELKFINNIHLKKHNLTTEQFKKLYPNINTVSDEYHENRSKANRKEMLNIHHNSSAEYLNKRYNNIKLKLKESWNNSSDEKRKSYSDRAKKQFDEMNKDENIKKKRYQNSSKSLKLYWKNLSKENYNKRCELEKKFWLNLSDEKREEISKKYTLTSSKKEYIINGDKYYFRSNFESIVAEFLINNNISFKYEPFSIKLISSKYHKFHIIDFFIEKFNLIIECHSKTGINIDEITSTGDIQIKKISAEKLGYNYECLWYDKKKKYLITLKDIINKYNQ